ncbi:GrpB family protein [Patescibacteria group bacterium]|nr:GrpB family protein [Patescibacteria group bacterium]
MITFKQEKWLKHLSTIDKIKIIPFDQTAEEKFLKVKQKIQNVLGQKIKVEHHGATSLGISGQDEIDIYLPVLATEFNSLIKPLKKMYGEPKSLYPLERIRFVTKYQGKHIDIFLINKKHADWKKAVKFETYLRNNPKSLKDYQQLKEKSNGLSVQEYYRKKIEFINRVLSIV